MTTKNKGGRPLKYTPEKFEKGINEYFESIKEYKNIMYDDKNTKGKDNEACVKVKYEWIKPPLITGLCLYLEIDRDTFANYGKRKELFGSYKKALAVCENYAEQQLFEGKNIAGVIFNMCNNYKDNWKQTSHIEKKQELKITKGDLEKIKDKPEQLLDIMDE